MLGNPKKAQLSSSLSALSSWITHGQELLKLGYQVSEELLNDAVTARSTGKRAIGVEYILSQFRDRPPNDSAAAHTLAAELKAALKKKGMGKPWQLPPAFLKVLVTTNPYLHI